MKFYLNLFIVWKDINYLESNKVRNKCEDLDNN